MMIMGAIGLILIVGVANLFVRMVLVDTTVVVMVNVNPTATVGLRPPVDVGTYLVTVPLMANTVMWIPFRNVRVVK